MWFYFFPKSSEKPGIVIELKKGSSCEDVIHQIKSKNYMQKLDECSKILLVGINYDEIKHHQCKIEVGEYI